MHEVGPKKALLQVRGLANGASATANWLSNAIVSQVFLALADGLNSSGVFWLLAGIACLAGIWTLTFLPETKGMLLVTLPPACKVEGDVFLYMA